MPTAPRMDTIILGSSAPRLDPSSGDRASHMLSRLKNTNQALDKLRRSLEGDESLYEASEAPPAGSV